MICRGPEVDFAPRFESKVASFVNQSDWDILLFSVHEFENARDAERIVGRDVVQRERLRTGESMLDFNI
jgi:hypothetical protein